MSKQDNKAASGLARGMQSFVLITVFLMGLAILIIEILGARVISPYYGSSVYAWSALITVTLASLAVGYFVGGIFADAHPKTKFYFGEVIVSGFLVLLIPCLKNSVLSMTSSLGIVCGSLVSATILFSPALIVMSATGPLAIRLITEQFPLLGRGVGKVYAISTLGSVLGALLTGFVLVSHFPVNQIVYACGVGILLLGGAGFVLLGRQGAGAFFIFISLLISYPTLGTPKAVKSNVLANRSSFYGSMKVIDHNKKNRFMLIDGVVHGGIELPSRESKADYPFCFELMPHMNPRARQALLIGLGAGIISESFRLYHNIETDVVEIDQVVVDLAKEFFGYVPTGEVAVEDGRTYVERNKKTYDFVILDAFASEHVPFHLFSKEFFDKVKMRLSEDGIFCVNTVGLYRNKAWVSVFKTISEVHPYVRVFTTPVKGKALGNIVFFASQKPFPAQIDVSSARPRAQTAFAGILHHEFPAPNAKELAEAIVFTDNFNPIDDLYKEIMVAWRKNIIETSKEVLLFEGRAE